MLGQLADPNPEARGSAANALAGLQSLLDAVAAPVLAIRFRVARTWLIAGLLPVNSSALTKPWRNCAFSRRRRSVSVARATR